MFDAVLGRVAAPKGRLGTGTMVAVAVHAGILAAAIAGPQPEKESEEDPLEVTLFMPPPPPPPPPAPPPRAAKAKPEAPRPRVRPDVVAIPPERSQETPPPVEEPAAAAGEEEGDPEGQPGGEKGGQIGGMVGGDGPGAPTAAPPPPPPPAPRTMTIPFNGKMERPVLLSGSQPTYTREARAAHVEGTMVVRCVITADGTVRDCLVIKGLPHLEEAALRALSSQRYRPLTWEGRPVNVQYVFNLRFKLD